MFLRVFMAMLTTLFVGSWAFSALFSASQDRALAETLAPLWAEALRTPVSSQPGLRATLRVASPVELRSGPPPSNAADLSRDVRTAALVAALAKNGIDAREMRLDDSVDPPVTWLRVAQSAGPDRWVGIVGGPQPSEYRRRLTVALVVLIVILAAVSALVSRWVAAPLSQLVAQIDGLARGETPGRPVRGAREIERLGDALQAMAAQRADDDDRLRSMLLGISHDLRSPLGRIRVAADLLANERDGLAPLIVRNVVQADAIIESFLTYLRADAHSQDQDIELGPLAASAARLAGMTDLQVRADDDIWVRGDPVLLHRCIANLIDNAQRHGAAPVDIDVGRDRQRHEATLTVNDTGPGIDDPARLRRPFERGDVARETQGAGLGLAIVDRIAGRHGGRLDISRNARGGAAMTLRLRGFDGPTGQAAAKVTVQTLELPATATPDDGPRGS